jgi:hypothetical protein
MFRLTLVSDKLPVILLIEELSMSRLFGIAGVQMSVVRWDADSTFEKMSDVIMNIRKQFPWVNMIVFRELVVPGLVQFVTPEDKDWWKKNSGLVPGPQTERLCEVARKANCWLIPGSMWEIEDGKMYNTSVVISPEGDIVAKYRKMFPWLPYVGIYNDFVGPLYFLPDSQNVTAQLTLFSFMSQFSSQWNLLFADVVVITIPPLIMFMFFQRQIVSGMTAGAIKG